MYQKRTKESHTIFTRKNRNNKAERKKSVDSRYAKNKDR